MFGYGLLTHGQIGRMFMAKTQRAPVFQSFSGKQVPVANILSPGFQAVLIARASFSNEFQGAGELWACLFVGETWFSLFLPYLWYFLGKSVANSA